MQIGLTSHSFDDNNISFLGLWAGLIVICVPFATVDIAGIGVLLLLTIPFLAISITKIPIRSIHLSKEVCCFLAFWGYGLIACLWSPSNSIDLLYQFLKITLLAFCLYLNKYNHAEQKYLLICSCISCVMICFFMLSGSSSIAYVEGRATISVFGASQDPNYIAYAFFFAFSFMLHGIFGARKIVTRLICILLTLTVLYCILLTGSRGAWISCMAIVLVYALSKYNKSWKKVFLVLLLVAGVVFLYPLIINVLPDTLANRFTIQHLLHNNGSNRGDIWMNTLNIIFKSPSRLVLGYGTGSSVAITGRATHNYFLQLLLEYGIVGLFLFISFIINGFKFIIKNGSTICLCVFAASLTMALTLSVNTSYYFWVTFLLSIKCCEMKIATN